MPGREPFILHHYGVLGPGLEVETLRLDDLLEGRRPPGLVKIDVEGGELAVLRGAPRLLSEVRPVLLIETSAEGAAVEVLLRAAGYRLYDARSLAAAGSDAWNLLCLAEGGSVTIEALRRQGAGGAAAA